MVAVEVVVLKTSNMRPRAGVTDTNEMSVMKCAPIERRLVAMEMDDAASLTAESKRLITGITDNAEDVLLNAFRARASESANDMEEAIPLTRLTNSLIAGLAEMVDAKSFEAALEKVMTTGIMDEVSLVTAFESWMAIEVVEEVSLVIPLESWTAMEVAEEVSLSIPLERVMVTEAVEEVSFVTAFESWVATEVVEEVSLVIPLFREMATEAADDVNLVIPLEMVMPTEVVEVEVRNACNIRVMVGVTETREASGFPTSFIRLDVIVVVWVKLLVYTPANSTATSPQPHVPVLMDEAHVPLAIEAVVAVVAAGISYSSMALAWNRTVPKVLQVVAVLA
jgi:hypothetical protein